MLCKIRLDGQKLSLKKHEFRLSKGNVLQPGYLYDIAPTAHKVKLG